MSVEEMIVEAIVHELCDRRGLSQEWEHIDAGSQVEIKKTWMRICRICLHEPLPEEGHPSLPARIMQLARKTVVL